MAFSNSSLTATGGSEPSLQSPSPLIFINSSNPIRDTKERRHKKVVSRWSVINSLRYPLRLNPAQTTVEVKAKKNALRNGGLLPLGSSPKEMLSSANTDPFESLPFTIQPSAWRLLNYWLNAGGAGLEKEEYRSQVSTIRKTMCFPLIMESEAAFSAAVVLFEITINPPSSHDSCQLAVGSHLYRAIPALRELLEQPERHSAQHIALAIILLMTVAVNLNDFTALNSHFIGLAAFISRFPSLITQNAYVQGLVNVWAFAYSKVLCPSELPDFLKFDPSSCTVFQEIKPERGNGFRKLIKLGLLSEEIYSCIASHIPLERMLERARNNELSLAQATDLLRCIWQQTIWMKIILANCKTPLDKCIRYGLILCFTLEVVFHPTKGLEHLSGAIFCQIIRTGLAHIVAPDVILWLCVLAGPHTFGELRSQLTLITSKIQKQLSLNTFEEAKSICENFLWPIKAENFARQFWFETQSIADQDTTLSKLDLLRAQRNWRNSINFLRNTSTSSRVCSFCARPGCTCSSDYYPDHLRGMLWAMSVADFRRMCDIEWFDDEILETNEIPSLNNLTWSE